MVFKHQQQVTFLLLVNKLFLGSLCNEATWEWLGRVDLPGDKWGLQEIGRTWDQQEASLSLLTISLLSTVLSGTTGSQGYFWLPGTGRKPTSSDLGAAVFHGKEYTAGNRSLLWALDGDIHALGHTGMPGLHCSSIYYTRPLRGCSPLQLYE